jgi:LysR family hydrogen peroxide-inducible transcriptional activator
VNIRDLHYLVAVAREQHFGRAALACHVSQPTLSTQLKKLEDTLGVTLIERNNRKVLLTPIGETIVAQSQKVLQEIQTLEKLAEEQRDPFGGVFRLGVIPTVAPYLFPKILKPLQKAFPKLELQLTEAQTGVLTPLLDQGQLDAVIMALPTDVDGFEESLLYREPFLFAVSKQHPLANRKQVSVKVLDDEQVLLLEDGHCLRDQALAVCKSQGAVENANFRATSLETLRQMVSANHGITLMPKLAVPKVKGNVSYIPFKENEPHRDIGLCWRATSTRKRLLAKVSRLLVEQNLAGG